MSNWHNLSVFVGFKFLPPCQGNAKNEHVSDLIFWALHLNLLTTWCAKNGKYSLCTAVHFVFTYFNCTLSARWLLCLVNFPPRSTKVTTEDSKCDPPS